jgi:hypothetical protein
VGARRQEEGPQACGVTLFSLNATRRRRISLVLRTAFRRSHVQSE